jgi:SAM-dependent methyltransferase
MGADHLEWAKSQPRSLTGIDLTDRAIQFTSQRLAHYGFHSHLRVADAEQLPFADDSFDIVYSYGVLHHSPDTAQAIREVCRVLRPGGSARIMIYHSRSLVGYMLWLRYALLAGKPFRSMRDIYAHHLESPGTKAFSEAEAGAMLSPFSSVDIRIVLGPGDLLEGAVGQRHRGALLTAARALWPRWFIRRMLKRRGLGMLITVVK